MSGWKTIIAAVAIALLGVFQSAEFKSAVGGCIFEVGADQPDTCAFPWWVVSGIAVLMLVLRWLTTTPLPFLKGK